MNPFGSDSPRRKVFPGLSANLLSGTFALPAAADDAALKARVEARFGKARLEQQAEVTEIHDAVRVQGVSAFDERLRRELYGAIYGDERFIQYANRIHPPIRIVVDRRRVMLTGYVGSRAEPAGPGPSRFRCPLD